MEETKYRRVDIEGGYIYDKDDIEYYRAVQKNDVIDNLLLGDFNMVGTYVINNSINEELIKLQKVYTETYEKDILCESVKKFNDNPLKFSLKIISNYPKAGSTMASLELLEEIKRGNGFYKNTNSVLVSSKVFEGTKVEDKIYKYFNIQKDVDGAATKSESDFDTRHIMERYDQLLKLGNLTINIRAKYDKKLYDTRVSALLKNKKAVPLLEEFNKRVFHAKDLFLNKNNVNYYRHLNQILDGILDSYGYKIQGEKSLLKLLREAQKEYADAIENIVDMVISKIEGKENIILKNNISSNQNKNVIAEQDKDNKKTIEESNKGKTSSVTTGNLSSDEKNSLVDKPASSNIPNQSVRNTTYEKPELEQGDNAEFIANIVEK